MACPIDFRSIDEGFGGKTFKSKKAKKEAEKMKVLNPSSEDDGMDVDNENPPPSKRQAVPSSDDPNKPAALSLGKPTCDGVRAGKVSGRKWKQAWTQRSSAVQVSRKGTTFEQRAKEIKKAYKERINKLKEEIRQNKQEKRKQKKEREKRKQENILRSGTKL